MGVVWLERRQNCASGYSWYVCSNGSKFTGCCSVDPCTDGVCPAGEQGTNLDTLSTASKTTTAPTTPTPTTTQKTSTQTTATNFPTTSATTSIGPRTTASTTTSTTGSDTLKGNAASSTSITTIPLNGSTTTFDGGLPSSTYRANTNEATKSRNNIRAIIGGVVGGVIFLILLVIAFFVIRRRRREGHGTVKPSGTAGFFGGLFPGKHVRDSNVNSMELPDSPRLAKTRFFGLGRLKRRSNGTDHHYRNDTKISGTSDSSPGLMEMPAPTFVPLHQNPDFPHNMPELESDVVSAPSELSSVSTPLYHTTRSSGSAWSPTPELQSMVSNSSSTGAVLSPTRQTHYSETSTAEEGQTEEQQPQTWQNSNLTGGGWPGMRANLSSLRRKPNLPQSSSSGSGSGSGSPQDPGRHVLSWMNYEANPGNNGRGGVIR